MEFVSLRLISYSETKFFVDLYKVVKGALLVGEPRYSIKNVEHLYRGKRENRSWLWW